MPYSTTAQVQTAVGGSAKLVQLTDQDGLGVVDAVVLADAQAEADALINSYAGKRYKTSELATGIEIGPLSARITSRILRRNRSQVLMSDADDEKTDRQWLKDLASGAVTLSTALGTPVAAEMVVDKAEERPSTKAVSRERLKGYC